MQRLTEQARRVCRVTRARQLKRRAINHKDVSAAAELSRMVLHHQIEAGDVGMTQDEAMRFPFSACRLTA
jgi:uncharacterized membrane protein YjjP (DUF1212 family)